MVEAKIAKLLIYNPKQSRSVVSIYIPEITPLERQNLGQLLMLIEIDSQEENNEQIIHLVEKEIQNNYYGSENFNIEVAFENALQKTNQKLHELIVAGQKSWLEKFSGLIAVRRERELHFAQLGNTQAFFIHATKIISILEQAGESSGKINPLKIFSNVISGTINENDSILFCTGSLLDYLSQEKLRRMITENPPEKAIQILNQLLAENTNDTSFAAVILKLKTVKAEVTPREKVVSLEPGAAKFPASESSMGKLIDKEKATSELLTPSLWPNVTKSIKSLTVRIQEYWYKRRGKRVESTPLKKTGQQTEAADTRATGLPAKVRTGSEKQGILLTFLSYLWLVIKRLFELIITGTKKMEGLFRERKTIRGRIRTLPHKTDREAARFLIRLKNLPPSRKVVLLIAVLLFVAFAYNIVNLGKRQEQKQLKEEYANAVVQASKKTNEAEAALIYENEEDARILLSEAKTLIANIPKDEKDLQDEITVLGEKIQNQLNKVNHIIKIEGPNQVADLSQANSDISTIGLMVLGDTIYAYEAKQNLIFSVTPADQIVTTLESSGTVEGNLQKGIPLTASRLFFYTSADQFYEYNTADQSFTSRQVESANVDKTIQDFDTYLGRIYTLDTKNNQIFRHEKAQDDYGKGTAWITEEELDVSNGTALAIDGSIYVAKNNGEIWKLFGGTRDNEFKVSTIDPAFSNPTKIVTTPELENIYILDPNNKRIVILNKDGALINQYFSEQFDNLKDFTVSEANKAIYLLNGTKIYKIDLEG